MNRKSAFSLVELMVVVAIIGILATIAIPAYKKFSARARQAYAKSELSGLFTAEKAFQGEYGPYAIWIYDIGFLPDGMLFDTSIESFPRLPKPRVYEIGVGSTANGFGYPCADLWPAQLLRTTSITSYRASNDPTPQALGQAYYNFVAGTGTYTASQICDASTFVGTAVGDLYKNGGTYDIWTINQNRALKNDQSGL